MTDIKQVNTLSKGLPPAYLNSSGPHEQKQRDKLIKVAPNFSKQLPRTNIENLKGKTKTAEGKDIPADEQELRQLRALAI